MASADTRGVGRRYRLPGAPKKIERVTSNVETDFLTRQNPSCSMHHTRRTIGGLGAGARGNTRAKLHSDHFPDETVCSWRFTPSSTLTRLPNQKGEQARHAPRTKHEHPLNECSGRYAAMSSSSIKELLLLSRRPSSTVVGQNRSNGTNLLGASVLWIRNTLSNCTAPTVQCALIKIGFFCLLTWV